MGTGRVGGRGEPACRDTCSTWGAQRSVGSTQSLKGASHGGERVGGLEQKEVSGSFSKVGLRKGDREWVWEEPVK